VVDTRVLLAGLREYHASLTRHVTELRAEFDVLQTRWQAFSAVYEGDAADQFRAGWIRTVSRFQEYITRTQRIAAILEERIERLEEANRTESGL
jgi:uncharacterized protein YukE